MGDLFVKSHIIYIFILVNNQQKNYFEETDKVGYNADIQLSYKNGKLKNYEILTFMSFILYRRTNKIIH